MSSEFYSKAQNLYEDFKNKEQHYLNAERKLNDSLMWKKSLNVPLKEYLEKIQQREKKNEKNYLDIMKQMNDLDLHTDSLCSKIEKLEIFRNIQFGHSLNDTSNPLVSRHIPQTVSIVKNFNTETVVPHSELDSLKTSTLKSAFTQTEPNIYCDNCKSVVQVSSQMNQIQNSTSSFIDVLSVSNDEPKINYSLKLQKDSFSAKNENNSQFISSALNAEKSEYPENRVMLEGKPPSLPSNEVSVSKTSEKNSENKPLSSEWHIKANDSEINIEASVTKNDTDSVNHEFDFLESEINHQNNSKTNVIPQSDSVKNIDQATNSHIMPSNKNSLRFENQNISQSKKAQEINDNKSEISDSVSGAHSLVVSLSDTDSVSEKGSFTASAAYQSLLGNTILPSKIIRQNSESESEDEVEKTLARSVQKSNIFSYHNASGFAHKKTKSSVQPQKDKSVPQTADSNSTTNKPKHFSLNKPQSKLSKSTKKVLGIDSSSSSEVEAAVKPPVNKKDEDSDEFDFYD